LTAAEQAAIDFVADELALRQHRYVHGVTLRQQIPGRDRAEKRRVLEGLVPMFLYHGGNDSYALMPFGGLRSERSRMLIDLAGHFRGFLRSIYNKDPGFPRFTWEEIRGSLEVDGNRLSQADLEWARFALRCVGAWGYSGETWERPAPERLEDLIEEAELEELFLRSQKSLVGSLKQAARMDGNAAELELLASCDEYGSRAEVRVGTYDTQQVCLSGHQVTSCYHNSPELRQDFCDKCGEKTIFACPRCEAEIRGHYHQKNVISLVAPDVPANCHSCGTEYPWTARKKADEPAPQVKLLPRAMVRQIVRRFHLVARQLRTRHGGRAPLPLQDEYDVQDLLHALLRMCFDDVRAEEHTPSYAGKSSRMDFLIKSEAIVVEVKMTRQGLTAKEVGSQLIEDIARYRSHQDCRALVCFVYDPDGWILNPRGLEVDLSRKEDSMDVEVMVVPQGH